MIISLDQAFYCECGMCCVNQRCDKVVTFCCRNRNCKQCGVIYEAPRFEVKRFDIQKLFGEASE